jgi:hypothetical protein
MVARQFIKPRLPIARRRADQSMAISIKQLLVSILFIGFAIAALLNHERAYMLEFVKLATFGTFVVMAYEAWASAGERRAFYIGFLLWGGLYYLLYVVLQTERIDLGTDMLLLRFGGLLDHGRFCWALYEKTGHLLLSRVLGVDGRWVTVFFFSNRPRETSP